jgi:hypothetical protein
LVGTAIDNGQAIKKAEKERLLCLILVLMAAMAAAVVETEVSGAAL